VINRLSSVLDFQGQALALRADRQRVLAGNIANTDTPGFQARDFDFANALREATQTQQSLPGASVTPGLLQRNAGAGGRYEPRLTYALPSQTNRDGNTVDLDRERASFADNSIKFEATLRFINGSVRTMLEAMKGPNQG
jgi:flagellar basal-body rod protein FlgB